MKDTVTLKLTRAEAMALDDLVEGAMDRLVTNRRFLAQYAREEGNLEILAGACDKLRDAVLDEPNPSPWSDVINRTPDKSRTLQGHDGLSAQAAFNCYQMKPPSAVAEERERIARFYPPATAPLKRGEAIEKEIFTLLLGDKHE